MQAVSVEVLPVRQPEPPHARPWNQRPSADDMTAKTNAAISTSSTTRSSSPGIGLRPDELRVPTVPNCRRILLGSIDDGLDGQQRVRFARTNVLELPVWWRRRWQHQRKQHDRQLLQRVQIRTVSPPSPPPSSSPSSSAVLHRRVPSLSSTTAQQVRRH
uniref:(northern house mosquito) hypothetical protein n=1 Tax=Culex pipiens TaxID=7175 RepID=A0A8D8L872_CULPI